MRQMKSRWIVALVIGWTMAVGLTASGTTPDLAGTWAMLQVYPRIAELPLVGEATQTSYVVQFVDLEQDELTLRMKDRYCFTVIEESSPISKTEIPDAFMASLKPEPRAAMLRETNGVFAFEQPTYIEIRGASLETPATDELPTDPGDPRVIDQDADGFPGMTVNISLLGLMVEQIYVVQRVQYDLSGIVVSNDRIEGLIEWSDEQNVLDATSSLLLAGAESLQDPNPENHYFVMLRAGEDWTCDWLRENWREAFDIDTGDEV